jgi:hypothetical protein
MTTNENQVEQVEVTPEVNAIDPGQMYTARLEFRSIGSGLQVQPFFSYSHNFVDDYVGEYPAAFLAMRDIAMELARLSTTVYNTEIDEMPEDPDEFAELSISTAQAQAESKH